MIIIDRGDGGNNFESLFIITILNKGGIKVLNFK